MAIDYTALLGLTQGIQVAKADYDPARDGAGLGGHLMNSPAIPAGSVILGYSILTTEAFTFLTTGGISFTIGPTAIIGPDYNLDYIRTLWPYGAAAIILAGDYPVGAYVFNDLLLTGKCTIWVYYLPT